MIEIKKFKFASNLEYVHLILNEQEIPHSIDIENLILFSEDIQKANILRIINNLNLDENEVDVDENFQKDFEDWHNNSLNPGHFTGGKIPFFYWNVKNYPFLLFTILFVPIISIIIILFVQGGDDLNLNFDFFGNLIFLFYLFVVISMLVQWIKYKKRKKQNVK
ncbi:hypothetical protein LUD75_13945 [Epilithonimonas sp. JDS]|uniref:hypothetical protein n=1 Tax=Epilithonimonas sp. JDS TaxID=2902797 RepID=UPI001E2AA180|nr:hypothetical protein [Epilithonimonas sp. JDS]MCD9855822.1 hypothetical protein [Epilithonimonas sp. JDS]